MYEYLITYFNEPIAIACNETYALRAIVDYMKYHKDTKREDYDIVPLKYYYNVEMESFGNRK